MCESITFVYKVCFFTLIHVVPVMKMISLYLEHKRSQYVVYL